jgi:hypothetical protein
MATLLLETTDTAEAAAFEQSLPPGLYEIRLNLASPISQDDLNELHEYFLNSGVDVKGLMHFGPKGLWQVRVKYEKHPPSEHVAQWQLIIPLIPVIVVAVLVGIGIFKLEYIANAIMPILIVAGVVTIVGLALTRKALEQAAPALAKKYL